MFRGLGKEVIHETCKRINDLCLAREQFVTQEGRVGLEMYFIVSGEVEVSCMGERLGFLGEGAFFGETPLIDAITGNKGLGSGIRTRTVRTLQACEFGLLRNDDVIALMEKFPELQIRLNHFSKVGLQFSNKGAMKAMMQDLKFSVAAIKYGCVRI